MKLVTVYLRFFRSFNFDYLRQDKDTVDHQPWDVYDAKVYPFVVVPIESDVTAVVGSNEAGKSQLLTGIECLLGTRQVNSKDFCRYSPFFGVLGHMPMPEFGGRFRPENDSEREALGEIEGMDKSADFWFFRLARGNVVFTRSGDEWAETPIQESDVLALGLPFPRRIDAGVPLPASISLYDLVTGANNPEPRDRSAWHQIHASLKANEATYSDPGAPQPYSLPQPATRTDRDREAADQALQLARAMFEQVAGIDRNAFKQLLDADTEDDGYSAALAKSITDALAVSLNFPHWWSQDKEFALEVNKDGFFLVLTMKDRTGQTYTFDERSGGMKYFLSYFVQYQAYEPQDETRSEVLLMDEPDAFLSMQGQQDLLKLFEGYAHPDSDVRPAQVLYVTHSPFLLDKNRPNRIRVLQKGLGEEGTRVVAKANAEKYEPLRSAFGSFHADSAFIGNCNLLVEGPADQILLSGVTSGMITDKFDGASLDLNGVTLVPVHGATQYRYTLHLTRGRELDRPAVIVLMDSDPEGEAARVDLEKGYANAPIVDPRLIFSIGDLDRAALRIDVDAVHEPEDLIPMTVARAALVQFARSILSTADFEKMSLKLPEPISVDKAHRIFDQIKKIAKTSTRTLTRPIDLGKIEFARAVSDVLPTLSAGEREQIFGNFATLFGRLNALEDDAMRQHTKERITEVTKRLVERFRRDHRKRVQRHTVSTFLDEVENNLIGASVEEEAVRRVIRSLRATYKLSEAPLEDVDGFDQLRARLSELVHPTFE